jgi:hypothetical protein
MFCLADWVLFGIYGNLLDEERRTLIFAGLGLLMGAIPSLLVTPLVALVCGILGLQLDIFGYAAWRAVVFEYRHTVDGYSLDLPGYLLAIAIVAFLVLDSKKV